MATRSKQGGSRRRDSGAGRGSSNGTVKAAEVARRARGQMEELTSQPVEGVRAVRRDDDGGWEVIVDVLELERIPSSTDVLGSYALLLDEQGEVREYRRVRRYHRNQVEEG
jgi:Gas vesicle synthesis protein GvpO